MARDVCGGLECDGYDVAEGDAMVVVDDVVVTTDDLGVDDEMDDVGMALDDTVSTKEKKRKITIAANLTTFKTQVSSCILLTYVLGQTFFKLNPFVVQLHYIFHVLFLVIRNVLSTFVC